MLVLDQAKHLFPLLFLDMMKFFSTHVCETSSILIDNFFCSFRNVRNAFASISWGPDDISHISICVHGPNRWLFLCPSLQDNERARMEKISIPNSYAVSWHYIQHLFLPEFLHLGQAFEWGCAFLYDGRSAVPMVWHLTAVSVSRILFRI